MQGDTAAAIKFLKRWAPNGPWHLTAISTDRKTIRGRVFLAGAEDQMQAFVDKYNGELNLYFSVNGVSESLASKDDLRKLSKEMMHEAGWLHVDLDVSDPPADLDPDGKRDYISKELDHILERLTKKLPKKMQKPTCILYSGGGYWAFWKLRDPFPIDGTEAKWEELESYNIRMAQVFGGDNCHNVDRIARLPGTINLPDGKKLKKGRTQQLALLLEWNKDAVYDITDFQKSQATQTSSGVRQAQSKESKVKIDEVIRIDDVEELDKWDVPTRVKIIIAQGHHPDQPKEKDNSRSAWLFDCLCSLLRCGVPDAVIYGIITDAEWGIAESVVEQKSGMDRYALRQLSRAKEFIVDPAMSELNDKHAVIGNIGGKCRIIEAVVDDILGRERITITSFEDFRNRYSNRKVQVGETTDGDPKYKPLGHYWLDSPLRRQYDHIGFRPQGDIPGTYNLWKGFAYEPRETGKAQRYLDHVRDNVCSGNAELYSYVIRWMARVVQDPASAGQVAIVLRGGKGTGKSVFATVFGRLFGTHHIHIANPSHLVGNFNAHLRNVISLFADEAFFAGDKKHESILKALITEDTLQIEGKGIDTETQPNYIHMIMASNDPHVIRATGDERRYCVLDMGEGKKQDAAYFQAMFDDLRDGGYEDLLYHLQTVDLTGFEVRNVPQTDALREQKLLSLTDHEEWWYRKLCEGRIVEKHEDWQGEARKGDIIDDYLGQAERWKQARRGTETSLGRFLKRVVPHLQQTQRRELVKDWDYDRGISTEKYERPYYYLFGSLEQCRAAWEERYGKIEWPEPVELNVDEVVNQEMPF